MATSLRPGVGPAADRSARSIVLFLAIAMLLSLAYWAGATWASDAADGSARSGGFWSAARGYGPALAAILVASLGTGRAGLRALGARLAAWRAPAWLYAAAFALPIAALAVVLLAVRATGVAQLDAASPPVPRLVLAFFVFAIVDGPLGEEIGWRGFLLPLLLERVDALRASLVVGLVWFAWHLPLYAADGRMLDATFLATYLASVMSFAVLFTWFFVRSGGSVPLAVLLHTTINYFQYLAVTFFPTLRGTLVDNRLFVGLMMLAAVLAAVRLRATPEAPRRAGLGGAARAADALRP